MQSNIQNDPLAKRIQDWLARPLGQNGLMSIPELSATVGTTIGDVRPENQDRAVIVRYARHTPKNDSIILALLCDGLGGMLNGGFCADIAISTIIESINSDIDHLSLGTIHNAIKVADRAVFQQLNGKGGTTLVGLLLSRAFCIGFSAGDSRIFHVSPSQKRVIQISVDDTIAGELSRLRGSSPELNDLEPFSKQLAQYIGMGSDLDARLYQLNHHIDDSSSFYLLSSDGAHNLPNGLFESVVHNAPSSHIAINRLIQLSRWRGGVDNASLLSIGAHHTFQATASPFSLEIWDSFNKLDIITIPDIEKRQKPNSTIAKMPKTTKRQPKGTTKPGKTKAQTKRSKVADSQANLEIEVGTLPNTQTELSDKASYQFSKADQSTSQEST